MSGRKPGFKMTEESKKKISLANSGRKMTAETKAKLSLVHKGRPGNQRKEYGESSFNHLYACYRKRAKRDNRLFEINKNRFKELINRNCFYCNQPPSGIYHANKDTCYGEIKYNGIDRKNNLLGYVEGNIIPCCKICNYAKHTLGFGEFIEWVRKVYKNLGDK